MIKKTLLLTAILAAALLLIISCRDNTNYSGGLKNNLPHGSGTISYPSGTVYRGEFEAGQRSGEGIWISTEGFTYRGQWQDDLYHGFGTLKVPGYFVYRGNWADAKREGQGIQAWNDGRQYEGSWKADQPDGKGVMFYPDGTYYVGQWLKGNKHGEGTLYHAGQIIKNGKWEKGDFQYTPVETVDLDTDQLVLQQDTPSHRLEVTVLPQDASDPTIAWESSDPDIATVEEGLIVPHNTGDATITVTALAEDISVCCSVTVVPGQTRVSRVRLFQRQLNLCINQEPVYLYARVEPADADNKEVAWSSSAPGIASVNQNGVVTPLAPGEATITARAVGSSAYDQCLVIVRDNISDD